MQQFRKGILAVAIAAIPVCAPAEAPPINDQIIITGAKAATWRDESVNVVLLDGPVQIELDKVKMSADAAVMWIDKSSGIVPDTQLVEIALIGHAVLEHPSAAAKRSGDRLFVMARVRGVVRVNTPQRLAKDRSNDDVFQAASTLRDQSGMAVRAEPGQWRVPRPSPFVEMPAKRRAFGTPAERVQNQARLQVEKGYTLRMPDGTLAVVADQGLSVTIRTRPERAKPSDTEQITQLTAARGVVFTTLKELTDQSSLTSGAEVQEAVESVYLEGDVRILSSSKSTKRPDTQLEASHVLYEVATDRAVLTDAVIHTMDPSSRVPLVMRASTIKQLSRDSDRAEYRLQNAVLTTSSFATPSYAVASEKVYVKQEEGEDWFGMRTTYSGRNNTLEVWGMPVGWLPYAGGSVAERGFPMRTMDIGASNKYGFYVMTEWGFFESIGRTPPRGLDLSYTADYLADRGPAGGINGKYRGSSVSDTTAQAESFLGDFESYFIYDTGVDKFGGDRADVTPPEEFRGRIKWEHQQFLPDDWQVQLRAGWISDATFLEEYFPGEYKGIEPEDTSAYIKHQRDSEAVSLLLQGQPNQIVTTQEYAQENFEVERLPELGYYRLAESLNTQALTLYSANTISNLRYQKNTDSFTEMGIPVGPNYPYSPGLPAEGYTGQPGDSVARGDFREEVAFPITIDRYRVQPYIVGRYTGYDNSPGGDDVQRGLAGGGLRVTTQFWRTDSAITSDRWDIHRMRHSVEPELHLFASAMNTQRQDVFVFEEPVDAINDITAVQVAVRQKWETKRGGPGNWQNADFITWDLEANFFGNKPEQSFNPADPNDTIAPVVIPGFDAQNAFLQPTDFRGVFFPSAPEASIPRDSINSNEAWHISDSTVLLSAQEYNTDEMDLATNSVGLAVRRGDRTSYYIGERYIKPLDSNILSFLISYELSTRYTLGMNQAYDFGDSDTVRSSFSLIRRFDRFFVTMTLTVNDDTGDTGFFVGVRPSFVPGGISTATLPGVFNQ